MYSTVRFVVKMDASADVFDVQHLRAEQTEAIEAILRSENVIAVLPTGFGKSLCYQIGTVLLKGFTVVVTPLLALCEDQIAYMSARGIAVDRMDSSLEHDEQAAVCNRIKAEDSGLKALYTTPETLQHNRQLAQALQVARAAENINFITIDEAHCVLEWSEFRYDLKQCKRLGTAEFDKCCAVIQLRSDNTIAQQVMGTERIAIQARVLSAARHHTLQNRRAADRCSDSDSNTTRDRHNTRAGVKRPSNLHRESANGKVKFVSESGTQGCRDHGRWSAVVGSEVSG